MVYSFVDIDFVSVPDPNQAIFLVETSQGINILETFKAFRLAANQTKIPKFTTTYLGFISTNYKDAVNMDANVTNIFTVQWTEGIAGSGLGTVRITANFPNAVFEVDLNTTDAVISITNEDDPVFEIDELEISEADTNKCMNVEVSVATSVLAVDILEPFELIGNTDNPIVFDWMRGQTFNLKLKDANDYIINQTVTTPPLLNSANFGITINPSPSGSTVIVNNTNSDGLELEYSLNGTAWQDENVFPSLGVDTYTLYVRDQYGCSFQKEFTINDTNIYIPYEYYSKSNAITMAKQVTFGDASNYRNDENTLSCQVEDEVKFKEIQLFQTADKVPSQFLSNYSTLTATVIKPDASTVSIPIVKKSNHIGIKDKRDAIKYDRGGGKTGIYFQSGNIYDYDTNAIIDTYSLMGYLPYWGVAGNYISLGASFYQIEDVVIDESKNSRVLVIDNVYTGVDAPQIVGSIFNYHVFEVYEYVVDMAAYDGLDIKVKLEMTDPNFETVIYNSELINVKVRHENTVEIKYRNIDNTDVFWATGIEYIIRQQLIDKEGYLLDESEIELTDTSVVLIEGSIYEGDIFHFEPNTKQVMQKIARALSSKVVFLDETGYKKNGNIEIEKQQLSNAYVIDAKMLKNGQIYQSQSFGVEIGLYDSAPIEIPGLVDYNDGFVQY